MSNLQVVRLRRAHFEKWAISDAWLGLSEDCMERYGDGYLVNELNASWRAWNAALDSVEDLPGMKYWVVTAEGTKLYKNVTISVEVTS